MTISERLFQIMSEKNITGYRLSKLTGISRQTINDWKTKGTNPAADKILPLCLALGVTPMELLQGKRMSDPTEAAVEVERIDQLVRVYRELPKKKKERLFTYMIMLENAKD